MTTEIPSRTSIWAAAARAVGASNPAPLTNPDTLASALMGPEELSLIREHALARALLEGSEEARRSFEVLGASYTLLVRTRFIDEKLREAVASGARQVVILGAGFDTRAYRFRELLAGLRVFEVDRPSTQQWKRRRVLESIGQPPANLTYVPIDFRNQTLAEALPGAGYDGSLPTFFIWEGVTMYLPEASVRDTLAWIGRQAAGSSLVFDFAGWRIIELIALGHAETELERLFLERNRKIAEWGEPWIFGIPEDTVEDYLASAGLKTREILPLASREAIQRYVGAVETQVPIRQFYFLADAAVTSSREP